MTVYEGIAADTITDVRLVLDAVNGLDVEAICQLDVDDALTLWAVLEEANRVLASVRSQVTPRLAEQMGEHQRTIDHVGTFVRHTKKDRKAWDGEMLVRAVLDSRLVDTATGEVADETPLDKVRACWNLGAPRVTALKARGIDPDEFCTVERGGFTLELQS